jgi:hypothetical protein
MRSGRREKIIQITRIYFYDLYLHLEYEDFHPSKPLEAHVIKLHVTKLGNLDMPRTNIGKILETCI